MADGEQAFGDIDSGGWPSLLVCWYQQQRGAPFLRSVQGRVQRTPAVPLLRGPIPKRNLRPTFVQLEMQMMPTGRATHTVGNDKPYDIGRIVAALAQNARTGHPTTFTLVCWRDAKPGPPAEVA